MKKKKPPILIKTIQYNIYMYYKSYFFFGISERIDKAVYYIK